MIVVRMILVRMISRFLIELLLEKPYTCSLKGRSS